MDAGSNRMGLRRPSTCIFLIINNGRFPRLRAQSGWRQTFRRALVCSTRPDQTITFSPGLSMLSSKIS